MSEENHHTNIEIWLGGIYNKGKYIGTRRGDTFNTKGITINNGYLITKDACEYIKDKMEYIQFDDGDLAHRIPVNFLLEACEEFNDLLWCDKSFMSKPITLKEEEYDDVEKSRWIE